MCRPAVSDTRKPDFTPPPGACDAHCHIFGPGDKYPYAPGRSYTPPDAPLERFRALDEANVREVIAAFARHVALLSDALGTALVASVIIALFGAAIEKLVALAVLMPIVASIGGNAGTQTMAVTVRAIATNQLTRSNTRRILLREMRVAVLNGMTIAVLVGLATGVIFTPTLGAVIALAMVINVVTAGFAGVMVPVAFERLDQDPAVASSVFVTMITDSMGFFAFLGLAYCQREGGHIRMDIVVSRLRGRGLWFAELLSVIFMLLLTTALIYGTWFHFQRSFDWAAPLWSRDSSIDISLPLWPAKLLVPVALADKYSTSESRKRNYSMKRPM